MQHNPTLQWMPPPPGFHEHNTTPGTCGFGMKKGGQGYGSGNRTCNSNYGRFGGTPIFKCNKILHLPLSNDSTPGTIALVVDMIQIIMGVIIHGICANQIITHL